MENPCQECGTLFAVPSGDNQGEGVTHEVKIVPFVIALLLTGASVWEAMAQPVPATSSTLSEQIVPDHVILFVLEGVDQPALKAGPMPVLGRLVKDGAVTWSAETSTSSLRLPAMASLLMGLPVEKPEGPGRKGYVLLHDGQQVLVSALSGAGS